MVRQNLFSRPEGIVDQSTPPFMSILDIDPWLIEPVWMFFDPSPLLLRGSTALGLLLCQGLSSRDG